MRRLALAGLLLAACGAPAPVERPNLILVIGDDVGYRDFGFMGSDRIRTPHLDRLAAEGTVFTTGYTTASVCIPSLRSLLTGLHPFQWEARVGALRQRGVVRPSGEEIQDFATLPGLLAERGYASFQGGKLWEASHRVAGFTHGMQQPGGSRAYGGQGIELGRSTMQPLFDFLDAHAETPFFVWFAPRLPHFPHDAPAEYEEPYRGLGLPPRVVRYYANVTRFDAAVGALLAHLDELGLLDRSLIVYTSDNGWDQPAGPSAPPPLGFAGPRGKMTPYELGFRTPVVLRWPGRVPAGARREELVSAVDLVPTLLDYARVAPPANLPGRSLRPLLEGRGRWQRDSVVGSMAMLRRSIGEPRPPPGSRDPLVFFLRNREWHYLWDLELERDELYRIEEDPRERRDLAPDHPELVERFRGEIQAWRREMARLAVADLGSRSAPRRRRPGARATGCSPGSAAAPPARGRGRWFRSRRSGPGPP